MRPGFVAGGPLSRAALSNIYRKNATARGIPVPGGLTSGTQELREPFSKDNISL
jgi:hypothetical protein